MSTAPNPSNTSTQSGKGPIIRLITGLLILAAVVTLIVVTRTGTVVGGVSGDPIQTAQSGEATGSLFISNWPLYIDEFTIPNFEQETGINVTYKEDVNDNNEFFGKVQQQLANGDSGGRDIMVVTDWMAEKMWNLGYLQEIDHADIPTVLENLAPSLQSPSFDPERRFSVPWQSGMTGLVIRADLAPDVTSVNDLFDPKYKGKVTMLKEMRDVVPLVIAANGVRPEEATLADWYTAIDRLQEAVDMGQIRRFTGNDYGQDIAKGDVVAAIGWSGDAVLLQADNPNIQYVQPDEGCSLWSDNMVIPVGAPNTPAALAWMNFIYEPAAMADLVEWVNYISPVPAARDILLERDPDIANNELIFPSDEFVANCFTQDSPPGTEEDLRDIENAFQALITG